MHVVLMLLLGADPSVAAVPIGGDYWRGTDAKPGEVWGVADLHAHFFNHLGFGGRVLHGAPSAPNGMREALASCKRDHGQDSHGLSTAVLPEPQHGTSGYPGFEGWPKYDTLVHQQAYVEWVRRAWQGGVRLVQMDVQNTPMLGKVYKLGNGLSIKGELTPVPLDDASALSLQVAAARLFFDGPASDFAAIARTSTEAREIIASGKMAVVLGIEVESLANLSREEDLGPDPRKTIDAVLAELWASGVRHVLPIHLTTNAFGQPAVFEPVLNAMNFVDTGDFYSTEEAFERGIRFDPTRVPPTGVTGLVGFASAFHGKHPFPPARAIGASKGLTAGGELLVAEMLKQGFIVDVEHMSEQGVDTTLRLSREAGVPIMSSHTHFRDLSFGTRIVSLDDGGVAAEPLAIAFADDVNGEYGVADARKIRSDRSRTRQQLEAIAAGGGMIGLQLVSGGVGVSWRDRIALDCDGSSKGFLQMLEYAEEVAPGISGIASDVGGFATMPTPRFGVDACPGARGDAVRRANGRIRTQAFAQRNGVTYQTPVTSLGRWRFEQKATGDDSPYTSDEVRAWQSGHPDRERWAAMSEGPNAPLERSTAGTREFDVNLDGMAHYGMLPDFFQDSANVARAAHQGQLLAPIFHSAEKYLQMWQRIERRSHHR